MDSKQKKALRDVIHDIDRKHGKGSVFTLGQDEAPIPRTPSGIADFDLAIGGGIPNGRLMEIFGVESAGKTSLAFHMAAQYETALYVDMEGTFDAGLAKTFGCRRGQLLIRRPTWGEQAMEIMVRFAEAGCPFIIMDSVPAMIPKKEFQSDDYEKQAGVAMTASLLARKLPKLCSVAENSGCTILFINQVRDKIGGLPWGDPFVTPGGRALKHLTSVRIKIARKEWIRTSNTRYGQICKIQIVKSKVCAPFREAELPLVFNRGFVKHEEVKSVIRGIRKNAN